MKILKSPQKALILFLSSLIVISFFMIVRLEGKAANLQSRLDEHHKSLEKNKDILENLDSFTRKIKNNSITIDGDKIKLSTDKSTLELDKDKMTLGAASDVFFECDYKGDLIVMRNKSQYVVIGKLGDKGKEEETVNINGGSDGKKFLTLQDKGIALGVEDIKDGDLQFGISLKSGSIFMMHGKNLIGLNKDKITIRAQGDINITSENGNVNIKGKKVNLNE
ncbi:MAG: hypothetical protein KJN64_12670 [Ignavibacteria bacterium]|nr:hypothetical protein [Ignavibacteria bacterium]MBT8383484.1 hypothetical protein [Ignavibacteria bacterium]MBT8393104.1 hypothetical protein [Ignavibacteria bacterium]NNJ52155.1 hypothetical protein [Ignavibacteriaceae bacterium]NNL21908.1 hypothetical protein [Ignavibacteriaceae bacterium]